MILQYSLHIGTRSAVGGVETSGENKMHNNTIGIRLSAPATGSLAPFRRNVLLEISTVGAHHQLSPTEPHIRVHKKFTRPQCDCFCILYSKRSEWLFAAKIDAARCHYHIYRPCARQLALSPRVRSLRVFLTQRTKCLSDKYSSTVQYIYGIQPI